jgi:TupA-like ATPgrasp
MAIFRSQDLAPIANIPAHILPQAGLAGYLRTSLCYVARHQKFANLATPSLFTELVQRRKLANRDLRMAMLADKVVVKSVVADILGGDWVIPTLWQGSELPMTPEWPVPFVLKSRHGCNQNIFFRNEIDNWLPAREKAHRWLLYSYGKWLDEWLYSHIPRGLLIEPYVGERDRLPIDYKIYTFAGQATHVQVHLDRGSRHRWMLFDRNWKRVSAVSADPDPLRPRSLQAMIAAAEALGQGFDFVRNDFYEINGKPLFGEMTFYPGSGLDKFHPSSLDAILGGYWLEAGGR